MDGGRDRRDRHARRTRSRRGGHLRPPAPASDRARRRPAEPDGRYSRRMTAVDQKVDQNARLELALQRLGVVDALDPFENGMPGSPSAGSARRRRRGCRSWRSGNGRSAARAASSPRRAGGFHGPAGRARQQARPGRRPTCSAPAPDSRRPSKKSLASRIVSRSGAPRERRTKSTSAMPGASQASFSSGQEPCSRPPRRLTIVRTPLRREPRDLVRRGLGRAPQAWRDLVPVEIGQAENAVIGQQHVGPGLEPVRRVRPMGRSQRAMRAMRRA